VSAQADTGAFPRVSRGPEFRQPEAGARSIFIAPAGIMYDYSLSRGSIGRPKGDQKNA
jgi:hypothetical protein